MGKLRAFSLATLCFLTISLPAAHAQAAGSCAYQKSNLLFFSQVVELVEWEKNQQLDCWILRLRLLGGPDSPGGNAMVCKGNVCSERLPLREGIFWWEASSLNENIRSVSVVEDESCTDVTFCVTPREPTETMVIDFIAFFEEGYFLAPPAWRPRWSHGVADLSALEGNKSHCQDDDPPPHRVAGSVCL